MAEEAAKVTEATAGQTSPESSATRQQSTIDFPYSDLDSAIEVAKAVQHVGGLSCSWDQLAAKMNQAANGGGFRTRVASAKTFGLLTYGGGTVSLTKLGSQICDPEQEAPAKAEAFLCVELYRAIHEQFKGLTLPPATGLEAAMVSHGVSQKQKERARQVFAKSATQAGFFAYGPTRLVAPAFKNGKKPDEAIPPATGEQEHKPDSKKGGGGGGGDDLHPFIKGLLAKLPEPETAWPMNDRKKWLQTALNIFDLMYTTPDGENHAGELSVGFEKNSAN